MSKTIAQRTPFAVLETIEVRPSGVHGLGVFARSTLRDGHLIGNYRGRRFDVGVERGDGLTYLFALSDGSFIDGSLGGNATRHLNHSCDPNCRAEEYHLAGGKLGVRIRTTRAVLEGQELFLDYCLEVDRDEDPAMYPCFCGALACRRTLVAVCKPLTE